MDVAKAHNVKLQTAVVPRATSTDADELAMPGRACPRPCWSCP